MSRQPRPAVIRLAIAGSFIVYAALLVDMIRRHAVNLLFADQWDFLAGLREHAGPWKMFSWQHGPHRMGLGYLFISAVYGLSRWDERAEAYATAAISFLVVSLALVLIRRIRGKLALSDLCLPALLLTRTQFEVFIGAPNAAHGPLPLLLTFALPLCWYLKTPMFQYLAVSALCFCAIFTGFGILLAFVALAVLVIQALHAYKTERARCMWCVGSIALVCISLAAFFSDYRWQSAAACFSFPADHPAQYLPFIGLEVVRPIRVGHLVPGYLVLGILGCLIALGACLVGTMRFHANPLSAGHIALFVMPVFSLLFAANAAVGRVCLGLEAALASRYVPYMLPLWFASYGLLVQFASDRRWLGWLVTALAMAMCAVQLSLSNGHASMRWFSDGKARWRSCYLETRDEAGCNEKTNFRVYPQPGTAQVRDMMKYLEERRLNLFKESN